MDTWRLLITPPARGAWNMSVDESILEHIGRGDSLPTLRLYAWDPPCLSLGHAQPFSDVDRTRLRERGWEVVRRLTGGRAILHTDEVTYAVMAPSDEPRVAGTVLGSYNRLARGLAIGLHAVDRAVARPGRTPEGVHVSTTEAARDAWQTAGWVRRVLAAGYLLFSLLHPD